MAIQHHAIDFPKFIVDELKENGIINERTHRVLTAAEDHHGYIAGGFASTFARVVVENEGPQRWHLARKRADDYSDLLSDDFQRMGVEDMKLYLGDGLTLENYHQTRPWWKSGSGDIDVWFTDNRWADAFLSTVKESEDFKTGQVIGDPTPGGFGYEFVCFKGNGMNGQLIQAITKYTGTPTEVVDTFDIYNAACYIKGRKLYIPEGWEWLLQQKMIHIHTWKENYAIQRLAKWVRKHHYDQGLTPASLMMLNSKVEQLMEMAAQGKFKLDDGDDRKASHTPLSPHQFIFSTLHPFMKNLTAENLVRLSIYYPHDAYNFAMKELCRRTEATLQQHA